MSKLRIYPDSVLRKKSAVVTSEEEVAALYSDLITSMINYGGIGIAAPQIGINKKIAVISEKVDEKLVSPVFLVNPIILEFSGSQSIEEGCLSVAGVNAYVPRAETIKIETGLKASRKVITVSGLLAIVMQHEIDHLNGVLFPDRLKFPKRYWCLMKARMKKNEKKD